MRGAPSYALASHDVRACVHSFWQVVIRSLNPRWCEAFAFPHVLLSDLNTTPLELTLYDLSVISLDAASDLLGRRTIHLKQLVDADRGVVLDDVYSLEDGDGTIRVALWWRADEEKSRKDLLASMRGVMPTVADSIRVPAEPSRAQVAPPGQVSSVGGLAPADTEVLPPLLSAQSEWLADSYDWAWEAGVELWDMLSSATSLGLSTASLVGASLGEHLRGRMHRADLVELGCEIAYIWIARARRVYRCTCTPHARARGALPPSSAASAPPSCVRSVG